MCGARRIADVTERSAITHVKFVGIAVSDQDRALKFYTELALLKAKRWILCRESQSLLTSRTRSRTIHALGERHE